MRKLINAGLATAVAGAALTGAVATAPTASAATSVNMEAVIKAAMQDPYKPNEDVTPGSGDAVKAVEKALAGKDLLADKYVDGHYGTTTVDAYAKFQKSLGYEGIDASGLPGKTSLEKLGFTLSSPIDVGSKTTMDGQTVNSRTAAMVKEAEKLAGDDFTLSQGSYTSGNGSSAGTHDGGGAVDIAASSVGDIGTAVKSLRQVGFAAWHRTPDQGDWGEHIHGIAISDTDVSPAAWDQVGDYYQGRNGLADNGPDDGPQVKKVTWEDYQRG